MSTLEQIRKRPALIISILGLALLLFLFTGLDNFTRLFGSNDTVAKVDGNKIDWRAYNSRISDATQGSQSNPMTDYYGNALNQLINETLLDEAIKNAGITVTDEELQELFFGPNSMMGGYAQQYGFPSAEEFYAFAYSDDPQAAQARALWNDLEQNLTKQYLQQKYFTTLTGALTANKIDAKYAYDSQTPLNVTMVEKSIAGVTGDFKVTDEEIKAQYDKEKQRYAIPTQMRRVSVINIPVGPSPTDISTVEKDVRGLVEKLKTTEGVSAVGQDYNYSTKIATGTINNIDKNLGLNNSLIKNNIDRLNTETVDLLQVGSSNNDFVVAKLLDKTYGIDSIQLELFITESPSDSIMGLIAQGVNVDSIPQLQKMLPQSTLSLSSPNLGLGQGVNVSKKDLAYLRQALSALPVGQYAAVADSKAFLQALTGNRGDAKAKNNIIAKVVEAPKSAEIYEMALITRPIKASNKTVEDNYQKLLAFIKENNTASKFAENAQKNGFPLQQLLLDPTNLKIATSGAAAKWVWAEAVEGDVSQIYRDKNDENIMVVALNGVYDNYIPVSDVEVKDDIKGRLTAQKKAASLLAEAKKVNSSNIEDYATALNVPSNATTRSIASTNDAALAAALTQAKKNPGKVYTVATDNGVAVFVVNQVEEAHRPFDVKQDGNAFNGSPVGNMGVQRMFMNGAPVTRSNKSIGGILRHGKNISYGDIRFQSND